jgi:hypothetical protein
VDRRRKAVRETRGRRGRSSIAIDDECDDPSRFHHAVIYSLALEMDSMWYNYCDAWTEVLNVLLHVQFASLILNQLTLYHCHIVE